MFGLTSPPDPEWDYYHSWMSLHFAKEKIDNTLGLMAAQEASSHEIDAELRAMLGQVMLLLEAVVENNLCESTLMQEED